MRPKKILFLVMIVIASVLIIVSGADNRYKNKKVTFTEYTFEVDENIHGTASIYACDLDSDGDMEILGASVEEDAIVYWRNDGGEPIKWKKQIIKSGFTFAHEVYACDLDLDGDNDILAASTRLNRLSWWRNDGGNPIAIVWVEQVIDSSFIKAKSIRGADFDQDGDMDIVGAALDGNEIAWWENKGGTPIVWQKFLVDSLKRVWPLYVCDLDNDGDNDIIAGSGSRGNNKVKLWINQLIK